MTIVDFLLMAGVLYGAGYLLYFSVFKKKGGCSTCSVAEGCGLKKMNFIRK